MSYTDPRWQKLRLEVMQRDHWSCVACGRDDQELHVHHIEYRRELWDTPKDLLQTLCHGCHKALGAHKKGGVFYDWADDFIEDGEGGFFPVLAVVFKHCPICGNKDNASHSGCVIFKCEHSFGMPYGFEATCGVVTDVRGYPAFI